MKPHYDRIRKVKTGSGSTAIQVGFYQGKRFVLHKHIGSAKDQEKIKELIDIGKAYIVSHSPQQELNFDPKSEEVLFKRGLKVESSCLEEAFTYLTQIYQKIGFNLLGNSFFQHFVFIRILEPASKTKSIILLKKYFNLDYKKTTVFRNLSALAGVKEKVTSLAIKYAKDNLGFDFSLVFYDVTTLYFETSASDDFRLNGFSKDNKINQPQVLVGLVVNEIGFPIYYDVFKGNTFEGNTIIPVILTLKEKYEINRFTVIADAGMLSKANLTQLEDLGIDYVVGSRVKNLNYTQAQKLANEFSQTDGKIIKRDGVIYDYSASRAQKDKADNNKQIEKAEYCLRYPTKAVRRSKFLASTAKNIFKLNETSIQKYRCLEGIKGYQTNITNFNPELLIARYKDLWKVEQSFRIAKSDLEARPIYHRKKDLIEAHLLIVFTALCMTRVIEVEKSESIKKVTDDLKDKWSITLVDDISGNTMKVTLNQIPH